MRIKFSGHDIEQNVVKKTGSEVADDKGKIIAPGQLKKHYSPNNYRLMIGLGVKDIDPNLPLLSFGELYDESLHRTKLINLSRSGDLIEAASNLFKSMHDMEEFCSKRAGCSMVQVMKIPDYGIGVAINDRLRRAAAVDV